LDKKLRLLVVGDLAVSTGFGRVLHSLIKHWKDDYDITGVGVNYRGDPHNLGIPIYPASIGGDIYGASRVVDIINSGQIDLVFILNDSWVINKYLQAIKKEVTKKLPKIVVYFPVDSKDHDLDWYRNFDIVDRAVTYTEFGKTVIKECEPVLTLDVIPHGTDNETFYRKFERKSDAKIHLFGSNITSIGNPEDSFIVLNANRNQPRKKLDVTMRGFALFAKGKPDNVKIYMHCGIVDAHINVAKLSLRLGIDNRLIVSTDKKGVQSLPDYRLNEIYNACDVGINTSLGEGWGLVNVEHAMAFAAQIVPNHSACAEIFSDCGILLPTFEDDITFDNSMTSGKLVTVQSVADSLEKLYQNKEERNRLAQLSYDKFNSEEYSWKHIAGIWKQLFLEVLDEPDRISQ
jgi:D-inositol-3-phosphate glycosyltransferase